MLRSLNSLDGYTVGAQDGDIGRVVDWYLDDAAWTIRYVVMDTGGWLGGRQVLLAPSAFDPPEWGQRRIPTKLTKEQVQHSPEASSDRPVSRQHEEELSRYYGWPAYWHTAGPFGYPAAPVPAQPMERAERTAAAVEESRGDPHLRSAKEVAGYHIGATDDELGHIEDFLVDTERWTIRYLVIDTRNWWPGKRVLVAPQWAREIRWHQRMVFIDLTKEQIRGSPEFHPDEPVSRDYEGRLYDYYGRQKYWDTGTFV